MITIRPEQPGEMPAIHTVHRASFPTDAEARLVDRLRAAGRLLVSLVALDGSHVVGHVAFSPVTAPNTAGGVGLAPLAARSPARGMGQMCARIAGAVARGPFVVILGDLAYYAPFGFAGKQWECATNTERRRVQALEPVPGHARTTEECARRPRVRRAGT